MARTNFNFALQEAETTPSVPSLQKSKRLVGSRPVYQKPQQLSSCVKRMEFPLQLDSGSWWTPRPLFRGGCVGLLDMSCHVSILDSGRSPHPPHRHEEEEILLLLSGEVDALLPLEGKPRLPLRRGDFVYYPADYPHTLEVTGQEPASYLMFKWCGKQKPEQALMKFGAYRFICGDIKSESGFSSRQLFDAPTAYLSRFHCHLSYLAPGAGYREHADPYNVAILIVEGEVETLGQRVGPGGVVFYGAGEMHGMHNPGEVPARYVVFEFQGRSLGIWAKLKFALHEPLEKLTDGARWRRKFSKSLNKRKRKLKGLFGS
jgi:uncharacterized cupin superfamily protein